MLTEKAFANGDHLGPSTHLQKHKEIIICIFQLQMIFPHFMKSIKQQKTNLTGLFCLGLSYTETAGMTSCRQLFIDNWAGYCSQLRNIYKKQNSSMNNFQSFHHNSKVPSPLNFHQQRPSMHARQNFTSFFPSYILFITLDML